jgi:DNA-nicking Smr family endonuclease
VAKKKQQQNPPKQKEFNVSPFGALKGLSAPELKPEIQKPAPKEEASELSDNGLNLFMQAVADVRPLNPSSKKKALTGTHPLQQAKRKVAEELRVIEHGAFLEEIGRLKLDTKFADSIPDEGELQPLAGNRLRQVKKGIVSVNHQLDLHGLTREEALDALPRFLLSAQKRGQKAVLVITGKGNRSQDEPVLHQAVASWLRDTGRAIVLEYAPAPREMGGSGAFVVFLRLLSPSAGDISQPS